MKAQKKFDQLDANSNGLLEGDELVALAEWVWSSFHPGGDALSDEEKAAESNKLLGRLDANDDGCMLFDEFGLWFKRTCASIVGERDLHFGLYTDALVPMIRESENYN